jgi:hypothetical protein
MNTQPNKDQSIITQVAAKIASELTPKTDDVMKNVADWVLAFDACTDALLAKTMPTITAPTPSQSHTDAVAQATERIMEAFPNSTIQSFSVKVKGSQHGPLPEWLAPACAAKGVTEVWDNRDKLSQNPKRPWFKAVNGDEAFWAPRSK